MHTKVAEIKLQMSQTIAGPEGLANEQFDKAEKKDAMGEIHRLHTKMAAFNSQIP
jgi:hypothetical protein